MVADDLGYLTFGPVPDHPTNLSRWLLSLLDIAALYLDSALRCTLNIAPELIFFRSGLSDEFFS